MLGSFLLITSFAIYFILKYGKPYAIFFYSCFLKPFSGETFTRSGKTSGGQQDALENFYKGQAAIYDATREQLLKGRKEMLALAAAQLKLRAEMNNRKRVGLIWVDIGGGTGYVRIQSEFFEKSKDVRIDLDIGTTLSYSTSFFQSNRSSQKFISSIFLQAYVR